MPSEVEAAMVRLLAALEGPPRLRTYGPKFILSGWLASQSKGSGKRFSSGATIL